MRTPALVLAFVGVAAADPPPLPHVLTAPTAYIPSAGTFVGMAGLDHRGDGSIDVGYALGGLAAIELGDDSDVRACATPPCSTDNRAAPLRLGRASFTLGARQDAWFRGQPALAFGVRTTFTQHSVAGFAQPRTAEAFVVASRAVGPLRLHAGAIAADASFRDDAGEHRMHAKLRPSAAVEWTPPQYPKTTLMVDVAWVPRLEAPAPKLEWVAGWGVRYQAFAWGAIELAVRHREAEGLAASTVLVRVDGVWGQ